MLGGVACDCDACVGCVPVMMMCVGGVWPVVMVCVEGLGL